MASVTISVFKGRFSYFLKTTCVWVCECVCVSVCAREAES